MNGIWKFFQYGYLMIAFIFLIDLFDLPGTKLLQSHGYKTYKLIDFPGH